MENHRVRQGDYTGRRFCKQQLAPAGGTMQCSMSEPNFAGWFLFHQFVKV